MSKNQFFGKYKEYSLSYDTQGFFQIKARNGSTIELCPYPMRSMSEKDIMNHFDDLKKRTFHLFAEMIGEKEEKVVRGLNQSRKKH